MTWREFAISQGVKPYAIQRSDGPWSDRWDIDELFDTLEEAQAALEKKRLCRGCWRLAEAWPHIEYVEVKQ